MIAKRSLEFGLLAAGWLMNPGIMMGQTETRNTPHPIDMCGWQSGPVSCSTAVGEMAAPDTPVEIISTHAWRLGYACNAPRRAIRDHQTSPPHDGVWILTCGNAAYRVTLVPGVAAHVERIEKPVGEMAK